MPEIVDKSPAAAKRTAPNCARCKNHGVKNILSGHKRYCVYLECKCVKCLSTVERQRAMAKNTAQRRAEKQHRKKLEEWRSMVEKARQNGKQIPPEPAELLSPILSPKIRSSISDYGSSERNFSLKSDSSFISPDLLTNDSRSSFASPAKDETSTSDRVDLRSSLTTLRDLLLQDNFPMEISTLLYVILKDTPEPKKAYNRIMEAHTELNTTFTRDEIPSVFIPYFTSPKLFPPNFLPGPAALSFAPSYYHHYSKSLNFGNNSLPLPSCGYPPYFSTTMLRAPATDIFSCAAAPLTYSEDKKHRLSFEPIQLNRKGTSPSNLCIRETSSAYSPSENKFSVSDAK